MEPGKSRAQSVRTAWLILIFTWKVPSNHAISITLQGYLGLGPALTEVGDSVVMFGVVDAVRDEGDRARW